MHATKRNNSGSVLAVVVVMLLAGCAIAPALSEESDAVYSKNYSISLFTDETFTYAPKVNLENGTTTITATGAIGSNGFAFTEGEVGTAKLVRTPDSTVTTNDGVNVTLTANWSNGAGLSQRATQSIDFYIYTATKITAPSNVGIVTGTEKGTTVGTFAITTDSRCTVSSAATVEGPDGATTEDFKVDTSAGAVTVNTDSLTKGQYRITLKVDAVAPIGDNAGHDSDDSAYFTVTVSDGLTITNEDGEQNYTYKNNEENTTIQVNTNYDALTETIEAPTFEITTMPDSSRVTSSNLYIDKDTGVVTFVPTGYGLSETTEYEDLSFTVTASASLKVDGSQTVSDTNTFNIRVYNELAFTSDPVMTYNTATAASDNPRDLLLISEFTGTKRIVYDWGDGQRTAMNASGSGSYAARHVYSEAGMYAVTITASNDVGSSKYMILYSAAGGMDASGTVTTDDSKQTGDDGDKDSESFLDEHGVLFIVFATLAAAIAVGYVYCGLKGPAIIAIIAVCALLSVLLFVYKDFGGIADALFGGH